MIICFMGIDGSGKTTLAKKLQTQLLKKNLFIKYIHLDSIFVSNILNFYKKFSNKDMIISSSKNNNREKRSFKGLFWCTMLLLDNILFYLLNLLKFNDNNIIISDRYFYDSILSCFHINGINKRLIQLYLNIFPKPGLIFFLDINPKIAFERKKEGTLERLIFNRNCYLKFSSIFNHDRTKIIILNSNMNIKDLSELIEKEVHIFLEESN